MRITLIPDEKLPKRERELIASWGREMFGGSEILMRYQWAPAMWRVLVREGDELTTHVLAVERECRVGGRPALLGGIGGVMTPPRWRCLGLARQAIARAERFLFDQRSVDFMLLVCLRHLPPYYESLGWQTVPGPLRIDQPQGKVTWSETTMVRMPEGRPPPRGEIDLCGLPW